MMVRQIKGIMTSKGQVLPKALGIMATGMMNIITSAMFAEANLSVIAVELGQIRISGLVACSRNNNS